MLFFILHTSVNALQNKHVCFNFLLMVQFQRYKIKKKDQDKQHKT